MKAPSWLTLAAALVVCHSPHAQTREAFGPCFGASAASAPSPGCGRPAGPMRGARWGERDTPGWSLMTPEERRAHHERMSSFTRYEDCKAYLDSHQQQMVERAAQRGLKGLPQARRDACEPLKPEARS